MMVLFDLDGTLLSAGGAGRRALNDALQSLYGWIDALDGVRLDGCTDPNIVGRAFEKMGRALPTSDDLEAVFSAYVPRLALEVQQLHASSYALLRGAEVLCKALADVDDVYCGLATGNIEAGARIKLGPSGLNPLLSFGGYGSDAEHRTELVKKAIERGQAKALAETGREIESEAIFVVGDTEFDVHAARGAGVVAVGVLEGSRHQEAMRAAEPDVLVDSLLAPDLWERFGLSPHVRS
jgi:phosphoglycolate phosphatase